MIEISAFVAVPLAGATLASMGADVIRVDPPGGGIDINRWPLWNGTSLYWSGLNMGKRSIAVDTRSPEGQTLVRRLVASGGADGGIVITNLGARGWASYESLREVREDLVMVVLDGNRDGSPAVDYTVNARIGFPLVTGDDPEGAPVNHVLPAWDGMAGHQVVAAVLAAERYRGRTGRGQLVKLNLMDVALAFASRLGIVAEATLDPAPRGRFGNYVFGTFGKDLRTRDGRYLIVIAMTQRQWKSLVEATGMQDAGAALELRLGLDLRDESARWVAREQIAELLSAWTSTLDLAEVAGRLTEAGVLWAPYRDFKQLVATDPEASTANPLFTRIVQPGVGAYPMASSPLDFGEAGRLPAAVPPVLGSHTAEVLTELLGISEAAIQELADRGTVGIPRP